MLTNWTKRFILKVVAMVDWLVKTTLPNTIVPTTRLFEFCFVYQQNKKGNLYCY